MRQTTLNKRMLSFALILTLAPAVLAQDITFSKTRYSSVKQPKEIEVALTITNSEMLIKGKKANGINMEIPYSSIDSMSYELSAHHRVGEGAEVMLISPLVGGILMATKTKSHWLDIEYHQGDAKQLTILRLDKSEYKKIISTLESKTGKQIAVLDSKTSQLNPTAESKDMDEVVPFGMGAVVAALKPAMETFGCKVTDVTATSVECKRARGNGTDLDRTGNGAEKVTAKLKAKGEQTRVRISTEKGMVGRVYKKNWSTPIFQEMMKNLQKPAQSATA